MPVEKKKAPQPPVVHAQLTADDFDGDDYDEDELFDDAGVTNAGNEGTMSLVQRLVDHPAGDDADKYDFADDFSGLSADELVESNEQAYDG